MLDRRDESLAIELGELKGLLRQATDDIRATRDATEKGLRDMGRRVGMVEVNVRALEDREVRRKAIEEERERVAKERHDERQAASDRQLTKRQFWIGTLAICVATILAALIASGRLF